MTGPEHYAEAESCLSIADDLTLGSPECHTYLAEAQVHATLALAAATAREALVGDDGDDWREVLR